MDSGKGGKGSDALEPRELKNRTLLILARCPHQTLIWRMLKSGRGCKRQRRAVLCIWSFQWGRLKEAMLMTTVLVVKLVTFPLLSYLLGIFPSWVFSSYMFMCSVEGLWHTGGLEGLGNPMTTSCGDRIARTVGSVQLRDRHIWAQLPTLQAARSLARP